MSHHEVLQALGRLPANIQAVMIAYYGKNMTPEEVAGKFKISERTVNTWIRQGLDQMTEIIWDWSRDSDAKYPQGGGWRRVIVL